MPKNTTQCPLSGLKPRLLAPELSALTHELVVIHVTDKIIIITDNDKKNCNSFGFFSRLEVKSVCERTFHNTGLYYFHVGNCDEDWSDDDINISSFCLVKVTQTDRYFVKFVNCIFTAVNSCSVNWIL